MVGLGFCFEDLPVGRQFKTIGRTVTEADITNFVNCTGMVEVLFTNVEFLAHESDIKQRLAPAALVYAFAEGLLVQSTMQHTGLAFLHMELNVENPVFAGDTIHAECEVIEARRIYGLLETDALPRFRKVAEFSAGDRFGYDDRVIVYENVDGPRGHIDFSVLPAWMRENRPPPRPGN